jgi:hypothetical protein
MISVIIITSPSKRREFRFAVPVIPNAILEINIAGNAPAIPPCRRIVTITSANPLPRIYASVGKRAEKETKIKGVRDNCTLILSVLSQSGIKDGAPAALQPKGLSC